MAKEHLGANTNLPAELPVEKPPPLGTMGRGFQQQMTSPQEEDPVNIVDTR